MQVQNNYLRSLPHFILKSGRGHQVVGQCAIRETGCFVTLPLITFVFLHFQKLSKGHIFHKIKSLCYCCCSNIAAGAPDVYLDVNNRQAISVSRPQLRTSSGRRWMASHNGTAFVNETFTPDRFSVRVFTLEHWWFTCRVCTLTVCGTALHARDSWLKLTYT